VTAGPAALWLRALRAADARGLLPFSRAGLTPAELAAEVAQRGEDRLVRLVNGWYYPISYGQVRGALSDEEADRLVSELEAEVAPRPAIRTPSAVEEPPPFRLRRCDLCGVPLPISRDARDGYRR
jgi:hypothetical protein